MKKIMHVITGLNNGGAEAMLLKVITHMDRRFFKSIVVSLMDEGALGTTIRSQHIDLYTLNMSPSKPNPFDLWKLRKLIQNLQPDLIQGWMYHGNIAASLATIFKNDSPPILWNIRQSIYDLNHEKPLTNMLIKLGNKFTKRTHGIIYNAHISAQQHEQLGYPNKKTIIIPNGFNCDVFKPRPDARLKLCKQLNITQQDAILIGRIGRNHLVKDNPTFLRAASILLSKHKNTYFILAGTGLNSANTELSSLIDSLGIKKNVYLLGEHKATQEINAALDITTSSSISEGFANIIGEAMACGVPCVVTNVGDSALIVDNTGIVVPPGSPEALANAWNKLIAMGKEKRHQLGEKARERILNNYSIAAVTAQYEKLYKNVFQIKNI